MLTSLEALHQRGIRLLTSVKDVSKISEGANDAGGTPPHDATEANMTPALVVGYAKSERRDARRSRRAPQVRAVTVVDTAPDAICACV